jgi:hypothetical protein
LEFVGVRIRIASVFIASFFIAFHSFTPRAYAGPKAVIGIDKLDFGKIKRGEFGQKSIPIRNDGDAPFEITKINSSCPCVIVEVPSKAAATVAPGKTYELPVRYDTKDRVGPQGAVIAIMTSDPALPATTIDVTAYVQTLVVARPPNGVLWGYSQRGKKLSKQFEIAPGELKQDIELIGVKVANPGITPIGRKAERGGEHVIQIEFTIGNDVPIGPLDSKIEARVRVNGEEAVVEAPFHGDVIGDILVSPPAIISPKTAYALGQRISEITVRASEDGKRPPELLGAMAVGAVKAVVFKSDDPMAHRIAVHAADNATGGPQSGTIYVMTSSADQPIVAVPVYFRLGDSVVVTPATVSLKSGEKQEVMLQPAAGEKLKIVNIGFEEDVVKLDVTVPEFATGKPASISISAIAPVKHGRSSTIAVIETDVPGGNRVYIPIAILPK